MSVLSSTSAASSHIPAIYDYELPGSPILLHGAMSISGSFAYVLFGVLCSQMVWYFRSYPQDPPAFKAFIGLVWAVDIMNFIWTVMHLYYVLIQRGVDTDIHQFIYCSHWTYNAVLILTEICCSLVELFFILRMWRFAEKKRLVVLAFIPYVLSAVFNVVYLERMIAIPCFPEMEVNVIWLILSYSFKILSDGVIAGTMIWLLYHRSRGVRKQGGTIRVIRALIYWTVTTGLILWISTLIHLLTYTLLADTYVSTGSYLTRGRIYVVAMLAVINDRRRCQQVIQEPESISLGTTTSLPRMKGSDSTAHFWKSMTAGGLDSGPPVHSD